MKKEIRGIVEDNNGNVRYTVRGLTVYSGEKVIGSVEQVGEEYIAYKKISDGPPIPLGTVRWFD